MNCRFCQHELQHEFIDLGDSPASNSFLTKAMLEYPEQRYPLKLYVCDHCFLVQVAEYKHATEIFSNEYVYFSSYSSSWLNHASRYVESMRERFGLNTRSHVVEIASNDGYLLQYFLPHKIPVLGIEPTANTAAVARSKGIETIADFFGERFAKELSASGRQADLLLGNNVLAHVPDLNDFVKGLKILLKHNGIITMEFPHLIALIGQNQFDTIYHEHFSYLSLTTVQMIFRAHGLDIFDVEQWPTHGGSLRIFARHAEYSKPGIGPAVEALLESEVRQGICRLDYYQGFQERANKIRKDLLTFLKQAKNAGKKIAAYGAAAKGNTLLNYCGIDFETIAFVADANPHKQGKYLPGSHIPVLSEAEIRNQRPDFLLILPWNIRDEIMAQLEYVRGWQGQFVVPIPELTVL